MGKPIAARNKFPFGVNGIVAAGAKLKDGTTLTDVRISKQRSVTMFDLLSKDGKNMYTFLSLTSVDKDGVPLDKSKSDDELVLELAPNTFYIRGISLTGVDYGFVVRLMLNKVTLQNGTSLFDWDINAEAPISVASVTVAPKTVSLAVNATRQLTPTILPTDATNKAVTYYSDKPQFATVSSTGLVTAVANGVANITVTTTDGSKTDTCVVTVTTAVTGVTLAPKTVSLSLSGTTTQQLTATVAPATASNKAVTYVSGTPATATVNSSGLITAVAVGTSTITVTTTDGSKTDTCVVTVTA